VAIGPGSVDGVGDGDDEEYAHLVPVQWRYAALAVDDPQRPRLRERLISGYLPVAEHIASRFGGRGQPVEDLIQVATVGLIHAVDRFEPARGSHFLAFAVPTITGEIRRYFVTMAGRRGCRGGLRTCIWPSAAPRPSWPSSTGARLGPARSPTG
jgi:RNA polymerase sigma-B factor